MPETLSRGFKTMKKIIAFLLITGIAGTSFHLDEVTKLPLLVHHFREHRKEKDTSLFTFLYDHYVNNRQQPRNERDKKENEQLPFKSLNTTHQPVIACLLPVQPPEPGRPEGRAEFSRYLLPVLRIRPFDIWQPPKLG